MQQILIPTNCPCCEYPLTLINDQLFCKNVACDAQLAKKMEHFCSVMGIKGMGPKSIEKLNLTSLAEIFYLDVETAAEALGSVKIAEKLVQEIEKSKLAGLATFLAAMSIPLIGNTASNKIASVVDDIKQINEETCKAVGLGDKATNNLLEWLEFEFTQIEEFVPSELFKSVKQASIKQENANGKTVCITGKPLSFKNKAEATQQLQAAGYKVVESVTKTLDYLVDEEGKGSSKRDKAEQYGITIITNLIEFLKKE